ncbi:GOLD domain-containing protein [Meloidogyne graminicola]|uniref:GOLD domain-containing protein n=1 Tax=Meloidogyne graminicola TaxID=189291 RepID=A0A8S9ZY46_9BILA|nr:GOLD domain-containing protein [Meloidogyne graminicola]
MFVQNLHDFGHIVIDKMMLFNFSFNLLNLIIFICIVWSNQQIPNEHLVTPPIQNQQQQEEIIMAIVVEPGRIECIYQPIINLKYYSFEIDYQVIEGGDNDITFTLKSPSGIIIVSEQKKTDGSHKISLDEQNNGRGDYAICFDNSFSYSSEKRIIIFFEIFLLDKEGNYLSDYDMKLSAKDSGLLTEQFETFNRVTTKVKGNLNEIERMQSQFRAIEARDRFSIEVAFERINFWSAINLFCLIFASCVQVYMVRSLLEDSRMGNFIRHGKFKLFFCWFGKEKKSIMDISEQLKIKGNECFKQKLYNKSIHFYTLAIEANPENSVIWSNRAQAYLNLHKPEKAYMDACGSLQKELNSKALFRRSIALNKLGLNQHSLNDLNKCLKINKENNKEIKELIKNLLEKKNLNIVDLTVFQKPEQLQSKNPLIKMELKEINK